MILPISSPQDAIDRARTALGKKTEYKLGKGGYKPDLKTPAPAGKCDCTGFLAWAFGISRELDNPYYKQLNGGWFETSAIYKDIQSPYGIFSQLDKPQVGAVAVYGDSGGHEGHIGLITEVKNGKVQKVIHCSCSAWKDDGDAIAENAIKALTDNPAVRYGWFSGYSDHFLTPLALPVDTNTSKPSPRPPENLHVLSETISLLPSVRRSLSGKALNAAQPAANTANNIRVLFSVGNPPQYIAWHFPGESSYFFQSRATINADGAPNAYNETDTGIDWLLNAGKPTRKLPNGKPDKFQPHHLWKWWGIAVDQDNHPYKQKAGHSFPGFYVSTTALANPNAGSGDPARYVDSNSIPFLVLPGGQYGGAKKGDFGWIINRTNGKATGAIFADIGPSAKLGELSIKAAELLGLKTDPKNGGTSKKEILYLVFPGSGNGSPRSVATIQNQAKSHFDTWGGDARVATLPPLI
jgi:hypothetical protein